MANAVQIYFIFEGNVCASKKITKRGVEKGTSNKKEERKKERKKERKDPKTNLKLNCHKQLEQQNNHQHHIASKNIGLVCSHGLFSYFSLAQVGQFDLVNAFFSVVSAGNGVYMEVALILLGM
jgi:hypothetical protein